jgi:hypothetical protein
VWRQAGHRWSRVFAHSFQYPASTGQTGGSLSTCFTRRLIPACGSSRLCETRSPESPRAERQTYRLERIARRCRRDSGASDGAAIVQYLADLAPDDFLTAFPTFVTPSTNLSCKMTTSWNATQPWNPTGTVWRSPALRPHGNLDWNQHLSHQVRQRQWPGRHPARARPIEKHVVRCARSICRLRKSRRCAIRLKGRTS